MFSSLTDYPFTNIYNSFSFPCPYHSTTIRMKMLIYVLIKIKHWSTMHFLCYLLLLLLWSLGEPLQGHAGAPPPCRSLSIKLNTSLQCYFYLSIKVNTGLQCFFCVSIKVNTGLPCFFYVSIKIKHWSTMLFLCIYQK